MNDCALNFKRYNIRTTKSTQIIWMPSYITLLTFGVFILAIQVYFLHLVICYKYTFEGFGENKLF